MHLLTSKLKNCYRVFMVEIFNRQQFEDALPKHKITNEKLWTAAGFSLGEFTYLLPVKEGVSIMIRSSIGASGVSAESGEDSIRMWLVNPDSLAPLGPKVSNYITRVPGWQTRMIAQLRLLYTLANRIRPCACGGSVQIFKVKKLGPNTDKLFLACNGGRPNCQVSPFEWLSDDYQPRKHRNAK